MKRTDVRIDCLNAAMRIVGVTEIMWLGTGDPKVYDYGQGSLGRGGVEFFIWKARRRQAVQR